MADNRVDLNAGPVLGIALDGMGYGADGTQWGGELLIADYRGFKRAGALSPVRLPGGDRAAREPWRCLYAYLRETGNWELIRKARGRRGPVGSLAQFLASRPIETLDAMMASGLNAPPSSSCGRLFDAVAAAVGICLHEMDYEGEAAMRLESVAVPVGDGEAYTLAVDTGGGLCRIDSRPMWPELLDDLESGRSAGVVSGRFHGGLGRAIVMAGAGIARRHGIERIVLSGGVFQNRLLFESVESGMRGRGLQVLSHRRVPANDGGLSLGQAVVAAARRS
jgi:hydrogenase maturation protein HypF